MDGTRNSSRKKTWPTILLSIVSVILGIIAGPIIQAIVPPVFQASNLLYLTFLVNGLLFVIIAIYSITLWNKTSNDVDNTHQKIAELAKSLNVKFTFFPIGQGNPKANYQHVAKMIRIAKNEILLLNYGPVRRLKGEITYDKQALASSERQKYYDAIEQKIQKIQSGNFKLRRIIQLPEGEKLSDIDDPLMINHFKLLAEIGTKQPEFVSLKQSQPFFNTTFMIIDKRYLLFAISVLDPDDKEYYTKGHFVFDDPVGNLIDEFIRLFDRIDAHSRLVKTSDFNF